MTKAIEIPGWAQAWLESAGDPLRFATGVMGIPMPGESAKADILPLLQWQVDMFSAIRDGRRYISVRSAHGVRKTSSLCILVLWALLCHGRGVKVPYLAGTAAQLRDSAFSEIHRWIRLLPEEMQAQLEVNTERIAVRCDPAGAFCVARTAGEGNPDAIQGFHSERLLLLIADEASAISDAVFERGMGALTDTHTIAVLCGNPTKLGTFFHRTQTDLRGDPWHCIKVSSFDVPGSEGYIDLIRKTYGDGSSAWKVRVLGEFPDSNDDALIARDALEAALGREVQGTDVQPVAGVDVARFGSDANCFVLRQGNRILMPPIEWRGLDLMATTGKVIDIINGLHPDQRPVEIMVDSIGLGAGVADRLRELSFNARDINVGESPSANDRFMRLRDELWFKGRQWFEARNCSLPKGCEKLIGELSTPTYTFASNGKIIAESKADLKSRGVASPNQADAFLLTLATFDRPRNTDFLDRHRRHSSRKGTSSWAA